MKELNIEVCGRVQGVLFRKKVKSFCNKNNLNGFVKNKEDGVVLISLQGNKENLNKFISWINTNPGFSKIDRVNYSLRKANVKYNDFRIIKYKGFISDKLKAVWNLGKSFFEKKPEKVPVHIAIIPDGNRRWAREKGLDATLGHYKAGSYDNLEELFKEAKNLGIKYMSIWGFSTENWKRGKEEIKSIFDLISGGIERFRKGAHKNKIRFKHIGRRDRLPKELISKLKKLEKETENYRDFNVQLCLDYGGRDEIVRAVNKAIKMGKKITEESFEDYLDTAGLPDVDLIIRTSGENRTSGFMPYLGAYSELYFTNCYFPDFGPRELKKTVLEFGERIRRFGGDSK